LLIQKIILIAAAKLQIFINNEERRIKIFQLVDYFFININLLLMDYQNNIPKDKKNRNQ